MEKVRAIRDAVGGRAYEEKVSELKFFFFAADAAENLIFGRKVKNFQQSDSHWMASKAAVSSQELRAT